MATTEEAALPLVSVPVEVPGSNLGFTASCFPGTDWSLAKLKDSGDERQNPEFARRLGESLHKLGAKKVLAPSPVNFNGEIIKPGVLDVPISLGVDLPTLYRNKHSPADGTFLEAPGDAGIFSAGGCGLIIATYNGQMIFAHAGRDSLLDRTWIESQGKEQGRSHDLVDNILGALDAPPKERETVQVWLLFFIRPEQFIFNRKPLNDDHRLYNQGLLDFLPRQYIEGCTRIPGDSIRLNLPAIAQDQLYRLGVPWRNIHTKNCFLNDSLPTTRNGGGRYLAAVVRTS